MLKTPSGSPPPRTNSSWKAADTTALYSAGFQTIVLPASSAGTMYQDGTATGKLPAVITATVPTGLRKVNSCLSDISLGTVCPYSRRPFAEEEVARVDDLANLAQRLAIRLTDLLGDQPGQGIGIVLDQPTDMGDRATSDWRRHVCPLRLGLAADAAAAHERLGVGERNLADDRVEIGGIRRRDRANAWDGLAVDDRLDWAHRRHPATTDHEYRVGSGDVKQVKRSEGGETPWVR